MGREIRMKLLAVDTSGPVCGVAVLDGDNVLSEYTARNKNTHSASLMPMIEHSLDSAGLTLEEMDALAVVTGPGSFTGVRIGVATIKAIAHGSGKPCIPVNALEAMAWTAVPSCWEGLVCPLQDARAGQVYAAAFRNGERLMPDMPIMLTEYLDKVREMKAESCLFTGDGAAAYQETIQKFMGDEAVFSVGPFSYLRPSIAGLLAQKNGVYTDYLHLKETYLRPPNAEKNKKLLEAMRHG